MPSAVVWRKGGSTATIRFLGVLILAIAQGGCWEGTKRQTLATLLSTDGTAEISSDSGRTFSPLNLSRHPGRNEIVRTTSAARLSITLLPNCLVRLEPDTSIEIVRLGVVKDGNETGADMLERFAEIKLTRGRLLVSHLWGEAIARLSIVTPHGEVIVVSNALFSLEADPARTRVTCASGSLSFGAKDATSAIRVGAGFTGESSGPDVKLTAADSEAATQENVVEALQAEQDLRDLASRNRNVLPR